MTIHRPVLDHRCLHCLNELSNAEKTYWRKVYYDEKEWTRDPIIVRVSCVACLRKNKRAVPPELDNDSNTNQFPLPMS